MSTVLYEHTVDYLTIPEPFSHFCCLLWAHMRIDSLLFNLPFNTCLLVAIVLRYGIERSTIGQVVVLSLTTCGLYPLIWFRPNIWLSLTGKSSAKAVNVFAFAVAVHKFLILLSLYLSSRYDSKNIISNATTAAIVGPALALAFFGLWLQGWVYTKIGAAGVYYGFKLGAKVPWCHEFPFTVFRHPQYTSGTSLFAATLLILGWNAQSTVLFMSHHWLYTVTSFMEEIGDQDSAASRKKN